jgi:hypothetical protein
VLCLLFCEESSEGHNVCVNLFVLDGDAVAVGCHDERLGAGTSGSRRDGEAGTYSIEAVCLSSSYLGLMRIASGIQM